MAKKTRSHAEDLRGAARLAIDATTGVTDVVEAMHTTIASGPAVLGAPLAGPVSRINGWTYGLVRGVTRRVGAGVDAALAGVGPLLGEAGGAPLLEREALVAAVNGVVGDHLATTGNGLAIEMALRVDGVPLVLTAEGLREAVPAASGELVVLVHGSCMSDVQWSRNGHHHGEALARDLGVSVVSLHYNSGLHVSENGAGLDALLSALVAAWPVPLTGLSLVGHSMGGLVARSACAVAGAEGWLPLLRRLITLGTPHLGAPLERAGNVVELLLGASRYSAPLGRLARLRSAGVTDLRHGNVVEAHWAGVDRFAFTAGRVPFVADLSPAGVGRVAVPLPAGVACFAAAASLSKAGSARLSSDGLVPVASALGVHDDQAYCLAFPTENQWVGCGLGHLDLLDDAGVYAVLRAWMAR